MVDLVVDDKIIVEGHQSKVAVLANFYVSKRLFELVLLRSEQLHKSIELARANSIEVGVELSSAIDSFLVVDRMKEHVGMQHELGQGVPIPADDVLTELLHQVADHRDVIRIGIELGRLCHRSSG